MQSLKRDFFVRHEDLLKKNFLNAMRILSHFENQKTLIKAFVKNIHPICSSGKGYDTSYSHPSLPFSIFISFPMHNEANIHLRLMESIYHEALHLLLTAMEPQFPLSNSPEDEEAKIYSPWKKENRPVHGIIHGAFVFKNLLDLFEQMLDSSPGLTPCDKSYLEKRCSTISNELAMTKVALNSPYIADFGRQIFSTLLKNIKLA